jgi:hypothetical protein
MELALSLIPITVGVPNRGESGVIISQGDRVKEFVTN